MVQKLTLLGSTGSIGEQTLDVVRRHPDELEVVTLTSNTRWQRLAEQAREFLPDSVVIADASFLEQLRSALSDLPVKVYAGADALEQVAAQGSSGTVVNALVGYAGMLPSIAAVRSGKRLALANKESLVVGGCVIMEEAAKRGIPVIPIDSEHSAIFQCLAGEVSEPERIIITASGGPFLNTPAEDLSHVTPEQALRHPNWSMGAKITIDSATLVNKGFEVIEAHWLFGLEADRISVLVHPQSIVHSMVEFRDGAVKAQLGTADMRLPIQYALFFPRRDMCPGSRLDFARCPHLDFMEPDTDRFPMLRTAYDCLRAGGNAACVMNAANEVAVRAFLESRIGYQGIAATISECLGAYEHVASPGVDDLSRTDALTRERAAAFISKHTA